MAKVSLDINGRKYALGCDDGEEERLLRLGQLLDTRIRTLADQFGQIGDLRLFVMAGITLEDEVAEMQGQVNSQADALTEEIRDSSNKAILAAEATKSTATDALLNAAQKIEQLAAKLGDSKLS